MMVINLIHMLLSGCSKFKWTFQICKIFGDCFWKDYETPQAVTNFQNIFRNI